ncbi:lipase member K-like isoform X1 [Rhynchophorus ferrugineus]|uniref:lipase member K-like isoform X1 n=1 Tax=Rhynchophorus ferrugineus TaxID=354439 RepID=UPI003FCDA158
MLRFVASTVRVVLFLFLLIPVLRVRGEATGERNNVCPTYDDYYTIKNNSKCWYDLGAEYIAPEIIHLLGYPVQTHRVVTPDGYILTVFRIPNDGHRNPKAKKHPVYLQHGLVATCNNFLALQKDSLAFVLWEAGYDVWLGNYRGTFYSEGHVNLTVRDQAFWDTSMDQVALIDIPAIFQTILSHTGADSQIIYIGHSLGTSFALMYGSEFPKESRRIVKMFVLLCPAYTLGNMISPYKVFAPYGNWIVDTVMDLKLQRIVSEAKELGRLITPVCLESPPLMRVCMQFYNLFYGAKADFGAEIVPVYFRQLPGGTSIKILNHAADLVLGNFRKYNYAPKINLQKYGSRKAPVFDISKIEVPTYIVYSTQDWATPEADARILYRNLHPRARHGIRKVDLPNFNHIDFVMGRHARKVVYDPLIQVINDAIN